jgi:hypothetical protein
VLRWPVREGLLRYVAILKASALKRYEHELIWKAPQAPHAKGDWKGPKVPAILTGKQDHG